MLAENETGGHVSRLTLVERRQRYDYTCPVETPTKWDAPRCADRSSNAHKSIGLREASVVHGNAAKLTTAADPRLKHELEDVSVRSPSGSLRIS